MNYSSRYVLTTIDDIKKVAKGVLCGVEKQIVLSEERRYDIALIINELLVNSFEHAHPTAKLPVFFRADIVGNKLCIGVIDGGSGFAHAEPAHRNHDVLLKERGRGLMIVRALCEDIKYNLSGNSVEVKIAL